MTMPNQTTIIKVTGTLTESAAAAGSAGVAYAVVNFRDSLEIATVVAGLVGALAVAVYWGIKSYSTLVRLKLDKQAAEAEQKRLNEFADFAINGQERRQRDYTHDELIEQLTKNAELLKALAKEKNNDED